MSSMAFKRRSVLTSRACSKDEAVHNGPHSTIHGEPNERDKVIIVISSCLPEPSVEIFVNGVFGISKSLALFSVPKWNSSASQSATSNRRIVDLTCWSLLNAQRTSESTTLGLQLNRVVTISSQPD